LLLFRPALAVASLCALRLVTSFAAALLVTAATLVATRVTALLVTTLALVTVPAALTITPAAFTISITPAALAVTAATLVSRKWPDPTFAGRAIVRGFVGASGMEEVVDATDEELIGRVAEQLAEIYPLPARPECVEVVRWPRAMPQYEVGHLDRLVEIESGLPPGLFLVGQAYRGAGIPDCVRQANEVAESVRGYLANPARAPRRPR